MVIVTIFVFNIISWLVEVCEKVARTPLFSQNKEFCGCEKYFPICEVSNWLSWLM